MPLSASSRRIAIGCVKLTHSPGTFSSAESNAATSPSRSSAVRHALRSLRITYWSPSYSPIASVARSGRPSLVTTVATSGKRRTTHSASVDSLVASASDTLGRRRVSIRIAPSSSLGMNSVPIFVIDQTAATATSAAAAAMGLPCAIVHSSARA
ncbi:hypothetical protein tb265_32800 [Gemmatimonadetes bacterium T265]|nr:hypothetical protein tb265_32800 [Gemmatimonadetes bacterium T265]